MYSGSTDNVIARVYEDVPLLLAAVAAVMGAALVGILVVWAVTAT
ncbi:hypothetical protein ACTPOK_01685 [Streptomyces inhibens]